MIKSKLLTVTGEGGSKYIGESIYEQPVEDATFVVPLGVKRIHFCAIGAGAVSGGEIAVQPTQGGGAGGLIWVNNLVVTPGEKLHIRVGYSGKSAVTGRSGIRRRKLDQFGEPEFDLQGNPVWNWIAYANGGSSDGAGGSYWIASTGDYGGGNGGSGEFGRGNAQISIIGAGGGAGGYSGNGGDADKAPAAGSGGASGGRNPLDIPQGANMGYSGGGVGIKGRGATATLPPEPTGYKGYQGNPGSGGEGIKFGGGGGGPSQAYAGHGAARIIWGIKFSYPDNADIEAAE